MADSTTAPQVAQGTEPGPGTSSTAQDNPDVPRSQKAFIPLGKQLTILPFSPIHLLLPSLEPFTNLPLFFFHSQKTTPK